MDHFSDAVVKNPIVGQKSKNPQLGEWHTKNLKRLPGLKAEVLAAFAAHKDEVTAGYVAGTKRG